MLQNAYFLAKIGADTAENERNFAESLPKIGNYERKFAKNLQREPGAGLRAGCSLRGVDNAPPGVGAGGRRGIEPAAAGPLGQRALRARHTLACQLGP